MRSLLLMLVAVGALACFNAPTMAADDGFVGEVEEVLDGIGVPGDPPLELFDENLPAQAHHGDGAHHEEVKGLPQLNFSTYLPQIFWLFVTFLLMYVFFSKKTIPEISSTIESRRDKVEGDLDTADSLKAQAEKVQAEYEVALNAAREKSSLSFKQSEDDIKKQTIQKMDAFKARSETLTQETEALVRKAKDDVLQDTQGIAAEIASVAAEKIVGISTDIEAAKTLVKNIDRKAA
ncbi:MAG: hypothetical protein ACPGRX_04145 [Bdellovibrionales bacterium]